MGAVRRLEAKGTQAVKLDPVTHPGVATLASRRIGNRAMGRLLRSSAPSSTVGWSPHEGALLARRFIDGGVAAAGNRTDQELSELGRTLALQRAVASRRATSPDGTRLALRVPRRIVARQPASGQAAELTTRAPDITHNNYFSFYLRSIIPSASRTEVRVQFHQDPSNPASATVAVWYQESNTLQRASFAPRDVISPTLIEERTGVARFDLDGDGNADVDVIARPNQNQGVDLFVDYAGTRMITLSATPPQARHVSGRGRFMGQLPDGRNYYWTGTYDQRGPRFVDDNGQMVDPGREGVSAAVNTAFRNFFVGWMVLSAVVGAAAAIGTAVGPASIGGVTAGEAAGGVAMRQALIQALRAAGVRFTESAIQGITRTVAGRIVWLETGNATAGLMHIMARHGAQFATLGLTSAQQVTQMIIRTLAAGTPVAVGARGAMDFLVRIGGDERLIRIVVASNGFIVTAHPL